MNLKSPLVLDTSRYEVIPDFASVSPRPALVITKATEGTSYLDPTFTQYFADLKQDGIPRGCYHFHRKAYSQITQAQWFCSSIRSHINDGDILILDVEEGGETAKQLQDFLLYTTAQFPKNLAIIYSRKNILDAISMTQTQKDYFRQFPIWTAGYPADPNLYTSPPAFYIPDQTKYGPCWLWQYSDKGVVSGVGGNVDVNWISPVLLALLPHTAPVPTDTTTTPHPGITRTTGQRNGYEFVYEVIDPAQVRFDTVVPAQLTQVSTIAAAAGAVIGSNCGEWNDRYPDDPHYLQPINYTVSNGRLVVMRTSAQPSLMITNDNKIILDHRVQSANIKHAFTGLRYLIENGAINQLLDGTEGHSRKVFGVDAAGHLLMLSVEGAYPNQGWTLPYCAEFMKAHGAIWAADFGGGGDVTAWADGKLLLLPENINPTTGAHFERYLPNVFLVFTKGIDTMNGTAKENAGRIAKVRDTPSRYGKELSTLPAYATIEWIEIRDSVDTGAYASDDWFLRPDGTYVNYIISGVKYFDILTMPSEAPPPVPEPSGDVVVTNIINTGAKLISVSVTWTDGTTTTK